MDYGAVALVISVLNSLFIMAVCAGIWKYTAGRTREMRSMATSSVGVFHRTDPSNARKRLEELDES